MYTFYHSFSDGSCWCFCFFFVVIFSGVDARWYLPLPHTGFDVVTVSLLLPLPWAMFKNICSIGWAWWYGRFKAFSSTVYICTHTYIINQTIVARFIRKIQSSDKSAGMTAYRDTCVFHFNRFCYGHFFLLTLFRLFNLNSALSRLLFFLLNHHEVNRRIYKSRTKLRMIKKGAESKSDAKPLS